MLSAPSPVPLSVSSSCFRTTVWVSHTLLTPIWMTVGWCHFERCLHCHSGRRHVLRCLPPIPSLLPTDPLSTSIPGISQLLFAAQNFAYGESNTSILGEHHNCTFADIEFWEILISYLHHIYSTCYTSDSSLVANVLTSAMCRKPLT